MSGRQGLELVENLGELSIRLQLGSKAATAVKLAPGECKIADPWSFGVSSLKSNQVLAAPFAKVGSVLPFLVVGSKSDDLPVVSRIACPDALELWRINEETLELTRSLILRHQFGPSWAACWIEVLFLPDTADSR